METRPSDSGEFVIYTQFGDFSASGSGIGSCYSVLTGEQLVLGRVKI